MAYRVCVGRQSYAFADLKDVMAKATPLRSGDMLAGIAAGSAEENAAAKNVWQRCRCASSSTSR